MTLEKMKVGRFFNLDRAVTKSETCVLRNNFGKLHIQVTIKYMLHVNGDSYLRNSEIDTPLYLSRCRVSLQVTKIL